MPHPLLYMLTGMHYFSFQLFFMKFAPFSVGILGLETFASLDGFHIMIFVIHQEIHRTLACSVSAFIQSAKSILSKREIFLTVPASNPQQTNLSVQSVFNNTLLVAFSVTET